MFAYLNEVRKTAPLVHCMTNFITACGCADTLHACGASPVMATDENEVTEIASQCRALCINLGALSSTALRAMLAAGKAANVKGIPVVLDPVGVGFSEFRTKSSRMLMDTIQFAVIRGNFSEIKALFTNCKNSGGIDAEEKDSLSDSIISQTAEQLKNYAAQCGAVIVATGKTDLVANATKACAICNGNPFMCSVTGTGCQLSALTAALCASCGSDYFGAACCAVCAMDVCGEIAYTRLSKLDGNATYGRYIIDALCTLSPDDLSERARLHRVPEKANVLLYAVTDRAWTGIYSLLEQVEQALKGGVTIVQLREKALFESAFLSEAVEMKKLCARYSVPLIINDNIDVALKSGADGVHVGQNDMSAYDVRRRIGKKMILGVTAKTVAQAIAAEQAGADYLGAGAVFGSATKTDAKPLPHSILREICHAVTIPVAAIGGINRDNIKTLYGLGLSGAAVVSGIFSTDDIEAECKLLRASAEAITSRKDNAE